MLRLITVVVSLVILVVSAAPASGQGTSHHSSLTSPVSIGVSGGLSAASRGNGAAAGLQVTFDLTDRLVLEAEGSHLGRGAGAGVMSGTVSLLVNLLGSGKTVPYLAVGGGLYGASFDMDGRYAARTSGEYSEGTGMMSMTGIRGFGMMGQTSGSAMFSTSHMPAFYSNRLGQMTDAGNGRWGRQSFSDPAISLGAGVRLELSPRFFVRPDARALVVIANGTSYTVGVMTIGFGYRF